MSTFMANPATVKQQWYVIDATDQVVGRLAVIVANLLADCLYFYLDPRVQAT